ncbi:fimbrial protein [Duganella violaceipulchra]|uniref:Major type 1 subunit fimbrin (Pilin) n=1 Tax=Duganella violaceipulchra TaxID=2849652 RepID=A0AA41HCM4_9BURK|nr:fimbrial protein [Duganella violaceicalia]MBV6322442.1 type 1 fimbrial protein [Duganella violaceicalia]MCP2010646.1 major type 1 subunit fimbrin (pilin) [Duganella violaceicalia]
MTRAKKILATTTLTIAAVLPVTSQASDATITIEGNIAASTCTIKGNGGTENFTVMLPQVSIKSFTKAGDTAGRTSFKLILSDCPTNQTVRFRLAPNAMFNSETGALKNELGAGNAEMVEVAIFDELTGRQLRNDETQSPDQLTVRKIQNNQAEFDLYAQYVARGPVSPGAVKVTTVYMLTYY